MTAMNIAICGGGISSLCLAYALTRDHPDWEIKIFEAASTFREDSAAVGLGCNAQEALSLTSPQLRDALDEAGGVRMDPSARVMIGSGPDCGRHVGDIATAVPQITVHRGAFWRALHSKLPEGVFEVGKKLVKIEDSNRSAITLHFEDGTSYKADALVGCDGINSITRQYIIGDIPAANPIFTKGYGHRTIIPMTTAQEVFGEEYCSIRTQHCWIGTNALLITDIEDNGSSMQCIIGGLSLPEGEFWPESTPWREWPKDTLQEKLADWGDFGQAMLKVFMDQPKLYAAGSRIHTETPTFCKGSICIAGDAAHTFFPTQGAGAGQAIEDALMLSTVLSVCKIAADFPRAFEVYDALRRPRRLDIAKSSVRAAMILTGSLPGVGMDPEKIAETLPDWGNNIYEYDLKGAQEEALRKMRERKGTDA